MSNEAEYPRVLDTIQIQARGVVRLLSKQVRKAVGLKEGDFLQVSVDEDGRIILEPVDLVPRSERYLFSPGWRAKLAEADEDVRSDRVRTVATTDDLLREIQRTADELDR